MPVFRKLYSLTTRCRNWLNHRVLVKAIETDRVQPSLEYNQMKSALFIATVFMCFGLSNAFSDTISYTNSVTMESEVDATVYLSQFDSSLGTLTGVYIEFTTALYGTDYQFDNDNGGRGSQSVSISLISDATGYFSTDFSLAGTGINTDGSDLFISAFQNLILAPNDGDAVGVFNVGGDDYGQWAPGTLSSIASGDVNSSAFADFIGSGNISATVNSWLNFTYTAISGVEENITAPTGGFSAKVVYEFIPEPYTIGLIGLAGFLALVTSRVRRSMGLAV